MKISSHEKPLVRPFQPHHRCTLKIRWSQITLIFLPSTAVISDSFPMLNECVWVRRGVFTVKVKSAPFCSIVITGLTSFLILITISGAPKRQKEKENPHIYVYKIYKKWKKKTFQPIAFKKFSRFSWWKTFHVPLKSMVAGCCLSEVVCWS